MIKELVKFTPLTRDRMGRLVNRHSERKKSAEELSMRINHRDAVENT